MKISAYTEEKSPLPSAYVVIAYGGHNYRMQLKNLLASVILNRFAGGNYRDEYFGQAVNHYPSGWSWFDTGGAGAVTYLASVQNHPGIYRHASGAGANAVALWGHGIGVSSFVLSGGEEMECIFRLQTTTSLAINFGFEATQGTPDSIRMAGLQIRNATLQGKTANGGAPSTTPTSYTLSTGIWYRARIVISEDVDRADFYLYDENANVLWSDSLTTNIPNTQTGTLSSYLKYWKTTAGAVTLFDLDFLSLTAPAELVR